jgi:hypothetical protein
MTRPTTQSERDELAQIRQQTDHWRAGYEAGLRRKTHTMVGLIATAYLLGRDRLRLPWVALMAWTAAIVLALWPLVVLGIIWQTSHVRRLRRAARGRRQWKPFD